MAVCLKGGKKPWTARKRRAATLITNPSRRGNSCRACRVDLSGGRAGTYRHVAPAYRHVAPTFKPCVFCCPGPSRRPKTVQKTSICLETRCDAWEMRQFVFLISQVTNYSFISFLRHSFNGYIQKIKTLWLF